MQLADRDHDFFEYTPQETSAAVGEMFRGFSSYIQTDAKSVCDALFRSPDQRPPPDDDAKADLVERHAVGCWSHARRELWEAAITKDPIAREGLARIGRIFELRRIAVGRKNWLFVGSGDPAQAAGNLLTLIASARLHGLDPRRTCATCSACCRTGPAAASSSCAPATG